MIFRSPVSTLELSLLCTFQVTLNGEEVTGFRTDKMRALLAYLCIGAGHAHRRESLMGLLWPDQPEEAASVNLRQALFKLRQLLGEQGDDRQQYAQNLAIVRSLLNEEAFAKAWAEGREMSMEQAIDYALEG